MPVLASGCRSLLVLLGCAGRHGLRVARGITADYVTAPFRSRRSSAGAQGVPAPRATAPVAMGAGRQC